MRLGSTYLRRVRSALGSSDVCHASKLVVVVPTENQPEEGSAGISDARLLRYAVQAGADRSTVSAAIRDRTYEQWVNNGTDKASKNGVTSTPTVKVNGKTVKFTTINDLVAKVNSVVAAG